MIDGIRFKVCGLTSLVDAEFADRCGADYLGFILHPGSPRHIQLAQYTAMAPRLPERRRVAVAVEPTIDELGAMADAGFDFFQLHFRPELPSARLQQWSERIGADRLWLAPRLAAAEFVSPAWLPLANFFLLDSVQTGVFGGTGVPGDWAKFARHQTAHPSHAWILAGGLNPANIGDALRASGARFVDVNSGVESAPGVKDHEKVKRFVVRIHEARTAMPPAVDD